MHDPNLIAADSLVPSAVPAEPESADASFTRRSWRQLRSEPLALLSAGMLVGLIAIAIGAPVFSQYITHYGPTQQDLSNTFQGPSHIHLLGTDELGRDTLTRLLYGARVSLGIGFLTVGITLAIGVPVGLLAGYVGGVVDTVLMRFVDVALAVPPIFLYILMAILFRPDAVTLAFIIASIGWAPLARLVRAEALSLRSRDFMLATRAMGAGDTRLIVRHLLPNCLPVIVVAATLRLGQVVLVEAALDFLGLGIQPPTPTWGNMLSNAEIYFSHSVWLVVLPGLAIFVTVICANLLGNALRDASDPGYQRLILGARP